MITDTKLVREKLLSGVNIMANVVKCTLGTKGRLVAYTSYRHFDDPVGSPVLTKDGVTVASQISSSDPIENQAMKILRAAAKNTVNSSGDGTTSTLVISQYLINKGYELLDKGVSSYQINIEIDKAVEDIIGYITKHSIEVYDDFDKLKELASISANNKEIGELIFEIINELGVHCDIEVKESKRQTTYVEAVSGMKLHKGYFSPSMCNDYTTMTFEAKDVNILVYDGIIRDYRDIQAYVKASQDSAGNPMPLLIYATDVSKVALNRIEGSMKIHPRPLMIVEHDGFGDNRVEILNDLCALTGAKIVSENNKSQNPVPELALGSCEEIKVDQHFTSILGGRGNSDDVDELVDEIELMLAEAEKQNWLNRIKFLRKRRANLVGGIAVIHVGGSTDFEMKEKKMRIDDAVLAVKSAIEHGLSVGGAYTWENAKEWAIGNTSMTREDNPAYFIVCESVSEILKQLLINSGEYTEEYISELRSKYLKGYAYNLIDRKLYKVADYLVYDATSVLTDALYNASSVAKSILAIQYCIHNKNQAI
jgi:chaperonin GroEL